MSTILYRPEELARWIGYAVSSGATDYPRALSLAVEASHSNARAYADRYAEPLQWDAIATRDELERLSLEFLARPVDWIGHHCPGLLYNCAEDPELNTPRAEFDGLTLAEVLEPISAHAQTWLDGIQRKAQRDAENDRAFLEVEPLPRLTGAEILARAGKSARVIVAEFMVNESDMYTDYHGGRSARVVVIGFGTGKRENFHQLRCAAAEFPPTADYGPGRDEWRVWVNREESKEGQHTRSTREGDTFTTEAEAREWIENEISNYRAAIEAGNHEYSQAGICAGNFGYSLSSESIEHRENWSIGGGNYLGRCRYSGWQVYSYGIEQFAKDGAQYEFFEAPRKVIDGKPVEPAKIPRPKNPDAVPFPSWSDKGFLRKDKYAFSSHLYRKEETAQADAAKLTARGYTVELAPVRSRRSLKTEYRIKLISEPATPAPIEEPPAETSSEPQATAPASESGELWTTQKRYHDKRGADFWLVVPGYSLSQADYQQTLREARAVGGWQSRAWGGAPSGFGFASPELAESFAAEKRGDTRPEVSEAPSEPATTPQDAPPIDFPELMFL